MTEYRKTPRRTVKQGAWIFPGGGLPSIPCMMLDLSSEGARIKLDGASTLPDEFILVLSRDGRLNRRCRTAWRKEDMIGVRFLAAQSITPARPQRTPPFENDRSGAADNDEPVAHPPAE